MHFFEKRSSSAGPTITTHMFSMRNRQSSVRDIVSEG